MEGAEEEGDTVWWTSDRTCFQLTERIIAAAMRVHTALGPGLLESAYEACLEYELVHNGFTVERQKPVPLTFGDLQLECGYRLDLLVDNAVIVEVKAIQSLAAIHRTQLLWYLKLAGCTVGLLINFNVVSLHRGIQRVLHNI